MRISPVTHIKSIFSASALTTGCEEPPEFFGVDSRVGSIPASINISAWGPVRRPPARVICSMISIPGSSRRAARPAKPGEGCRRGRRDRTDDLTGQSGGRLDMPLALLVAGQQVDPTPRVWVLHHRTGRRGPE